MIDRVVPDQRALIDGNADVKLISITAPEIQSVWFRMDKEPFGSNLDLRKAVAWGMDRESMAAIVGGNTLVADSHLAAGIEYRAAQSPLYSFDPDKAKAAIAAGGGARWPSSSARRRAFIPSAKRSASSCSRTSTRSAST